MQVERTILKVEKVKKTFLSPDGERNLIVDVPHLSVREGDHIAVRGDSGSGKTTFLNLIAGILKVDSGSIELDGTELTLLSESQRDSLRARTIGYIFQTFNLLQGYSALENVILAMMFSGVVDRGHAVGLLEQLGLGNRINHKPKQLSVGQQQRVALARAMANKPKLVLADEPTGNLDLRQSGEAVKIIRDICIVCGAALILVSHDINVLKDFDTIYDFASMNKAFSY